MKQRKLRLTTNNIGETRPIPFLKNAKSPYNSKPHVSTWFLTLNSNITANNSIHQQAIEQNLVDVLRETFENPEKLTRFLQFNYRELGLDSEGPLHLTPELIQDPVLFPDFPQGNKNMKLDYVTEMGSKKKRIHLHAEFQILHYSLLRMDYRELQNVIHQELDLRTEKNGFDSVYVNAKFVRSPIPLLNYMGKSKNMEKELKKTIKQRVDETDLNVDDLFKKLTI